MIRMKKKEELKKRTLENRDMSNQKKNKTDLKEFHAEGWNDHQMMKGSWKKQKKKYKC